MWFHETFLCFENLEVLRIASRFITLIGEEKKNIHYLWITHHMVSRIPNFTNWPIKLLDWQKINKLHIKNFFVFYYKS